MPKTIDDFSALSALASDDSLLIWDESASATLKVLLSVLKPFIRNLSVVSKTSSYTVAAGDDVILGDASGGAFTLTLPTAVGIAGVQKRFVNVGASGTVTIDGDGSETINGATTKALSTQWASVTLVSDGSNWIVLADA